MGEVVRLITGRRMRGRKIPKPVECADCGEPVETKRLQVIKTAKRCVRCEQAREHRHRRLLDTARDRDIVIIRG